LHAELAAQTFQGIQSKFANPAVPQPAEIRFRHADPLREFATPNALAGHDDVQTKSDWHANNLSQSSN
jgi:hypothetical protein